MRIKVPVTLTHSCSVFSEIVLQQSKTKSQKFPPSLFSLIACPASPSQAVGLLCCCEPPVPPPSTPVHHRHPPPLALARLVWAGGRRPSSPGRTGSKERGGRTASSGGRCPSPRQLLTGQRGPTGPEPGRLNSPYSYGTSWRQQHTEKGGEKKKTNKKEGKGE